MTALDRMLELLFSVSSNPVGDLTYGLGFAAFAFGTLFIVALALENNRP